MKIRVDYYNRSDCMMHLYECCIGWRKLFEHSQDVLREIRKKELLPDDLYLKAVRICEIEELPKRYLKSCINTKEKGEKR